jgi:pilus assembly protein CpaB
MRPKTLILFFVAIGCGLVASIGVSQYMERAGGGVALETVKVFVATTEINIGEKLDDKNIKLEEWPKDRVPEGAVTEFKKLENMYPRSRFYKGEPILEAKLSDTIVGGHAKSIPDGYRMVTVKVDAATGGGGLINPGDRVDVVVFLRKSQEVPETETKTILRDVNVFAVEGETERQVDKSGQAREVRTISLLVKPKQAEALMLAKELGTLSLTLRRPNDTNEESSDGANVRLLTGSDGETANEKKNKDEEKESGLAKWLSQSANQIAAAAPVIQPVPVVEEPPKFVMKIRTPNGDREYRWKDLNGEPEEAGAASNIAVPLPGPASQPISYPATVAPQPVPTETVTDGPIAEESEGAETDTVAPVEMDLNEK